MSAPIYSNPGVQRKTPDPSWKRAGGHRRRPAGPTSPSLSSLAGHPAVRTEPKGTGLDPSIYLHVQRGDATFWYVINSTTSEENLIPCFPTPPKPFLNSGCGVIGPMIYVAGGEDVDDSVLQDVYCIDTRHPASGWKKGCPMKEPRRNPRLVTVGRKLYAFGGMLRDESSYAEVFDESKFRWNALQNPSSSVADLLPFHCTVYGAHAVLNKNNMMKPESMILFHGKVLPSLNQYNIELDSWDTFSESSLGLGKNTSALVDGILYCLDRRMPGFMFGLDISDRENKLQPVLGFEPFNNRGNIKWRPLPQADFEGSTGPTGFLVSLGESKLAVLWGAAEDGLRACADDDGAEFFVSYSVLNMSKQVNSITGRVEFMADILSVSYYNLLMGSRLMSCLPVFPSEKQSEIEGISKDGSMTSGSRSNKSNFYEKKKGRNKNTKKP